MIVLTGRGAETDRVRGLTAGADDYLTKPFIYGELRARIGAVLRRRASRRDGPIRVGELIVDPLRRRVTVGDREVPLAKKEFTLLRVLAGDPTRVFTKEELLRRRSGATAAPARPGPWTHTPAACVANSTRSTAATSSTAGESATA